MKERCLALCEIRSTKSSPLATGGTKQLPDGLVGPRSIVPVQIEGVYGRAILDSGSVVTILYRNFYDTYLKHIPIHPLEELELWGLSNEQYPYDGYLSI